MPDVAFALRQRIDDVTDGDDAVHMLAVFADHHAAGVMKLHQVSGLGDSVVWAHLDHGIAFQVQKCTNFHGCSPSRPLPDYMGVLSDDRRGKG